MGFVRVTTVIVGLLPIVLRSIHRTVLQMTFLAKAIQASLSVLVLLVFYAPWFGTRGGALLSILGSMVATIGWFLMGNPFGIDNAYVALVFPLVVMAASSMVAWVRIGPALPVEEIRPRAAIVPAGERRLARSSPAENKVPERTPGAGKQASRSSRALSLSGVG